MGYNLKSKKLLEARTSSVMYLKDIVIQISMIILKYRFWRSMEVFLRKGERQMLNVEMVEIYADKFSEGLVVIEFSEFEGFNRVEVQMTRTMLVCFEIQLKKCIDALGIDRSKVRPGILIKKS